MIVFDGEMGICKFGSAAPPFGKVVCVVKVLSKVYIVSQAGITNDI